MPWTIVFHIFDQIFCHFSRIARFRLPLQIDWTGCHQDGCQHCRWLRWFLHLQLYQLLIVTVWIGCLTEIRSTVTAVHINDLCLGSNAIGSGILFDGDSFDAKIREKIIKFSIDNKLILRANFVPFILPIICGWIQFMFAGTQPNDIDRFVAIHFTSQNGRVTLLHRHNTRWRRKIWWRCVEIDWVNLILMRT